MEAPSPVLRLLFTAVDTGLVLTKVGLAAMGEALPEPVVLEEETEGITRRSERLTVGLETVELRGGAVAEGEVANERRLLDTATTFSHKTFASSSGRREISSKFLGK